MADIETGFFLSAVMDSDAISVCASGVRAQIRYFTVGFKSASMATEAAAPVEMARGINGEQTEIVLRRESIRHGWDGWLESAGRPSVDGLHASGAFAFRLANSQSVRRPAVLCPVRWRARCSRVHLPVRCPCAHTTPTPCPDGVTGRQRPKPATSSSPVGVLGGSS